MEEGIINKVANSGLIPLDLGEFYPKNERVIFDLKANLWQGIALREKEFRMFVSDNDWAQYQDKFVAITCSEDAIIPSWAYMLLTVSLEPFAKLITYGNLGDLEKVICIQTISELNIDGYIDQRVIVKGCSNIPNQEMALVELTKRLKPVVKSLMFGEACSTVPLYKKSK